MLLVSPAIGEPPVGAVYQRYCPLLPPEAFSSTEEEGAQEDPGVTPGCGGEVLMVAVTEARALSQMPLLIETK